MIASLIRFFPFNRRSENRAQVTLRASRGKPIVSVEVERRLLVNLSTSLVWRKAFFPEVIKMGDVIDYP